MTTVFLDLDGTLTDAGEGILNSVDYALRKLSLPGLSGDNRWIVGPPLWPSFAQLGVQNDDLDRAVGYYRERYIEMGWKENKLYDGILDQLAKLKEAGYMLCLATSKPHSYARKITAYFGISNFMSFEFGSELDGRNSDKPALLAHGLAVVGAEGERAIMVGDRVYDIQGAQANGMKALGVSYGYGGLAELQEAGADAIISDPQKLAKTVSGLLPL